MVEFTILIQTPEDTTTDGDKAALVSTALELSPDVTGAQTALAQETGVISSSMRISAFSLDAAQEIAIRVFTAALGLAGLSSDHGWLDVETRDRKDPDGRDHVNVVHPSR
jgi:hypothetical protein